MNRNSFLSKVFKWFSVGLFVTFFVSFIVSTNETLLKFIFNGRMIYIIIILELICAIWLSAGIRKISTNTAVVLYLGYTALTGLTFSSIFVIYMIDSIIWIFLATAIIFALFAFIGKNLSADLRKFGIYLLIALLAVIVLELINIFVMNNTLDMILCVAGIIIFTLYVSYDINVICKHYDDNDNFAIIGAFNLYLDFINIFIKLLRLFGKRRN